MNIVQKAKEIAELVQQYNNQDLYQKIIDLRDDIFELREENLELKERLKECEESKDIARELKREGNAYYRYHDGSKSGPYCPVCWDGDRKLITMYVSKDDRPLSCGRCIIRRNTTSK